MKVKTRLAIGFLIVVSLLVPAIIVSLHTYHQIHREFEALKEDILPGAMAVARMNAAVTQAHHHLMEYIIHHREEDEKLVQSTLEKLHQTGLAHLEREKHIGPQEQDSAEQLLAKIKRFGSAVTGIVDLKKKNLIADELLRKEDQTVHPAYAALIEQIREHRTTHMQELTEAKNAVHTAHATGIRAVLLATACALLVAVIAALITARSIINPLRTLQKGVTQVAKGNLDYRIAMQRKDEIGQLSRAFDKMTGDLAKTTTSIDKLNDQITQRKQLEESLRQAQQAAQNANEAKSDFLANMSHEIRTPMTAILGYTDLLMDPDLSPSDRDNHLAVIRRNGEHLLSLINDILDLSKIEAGKLSMEAQPCNLLSIVADVASMMRVRADQRGTSLSTHYTNQLPEAILTDGPHLRQALMNLLGNAIKFTENGSVRIVVTFLPDWRDQKPAVQIQVIDTGIGISEEKLAKLFDPFVQADASTSRKYGGTGLGLAISHHIAALLAGELTVQSTLGVGSTFTLVVPTGSLEGVRILDSPAEVVRQLSAQGHGPQEKDLTSLRVLVAEDGIDNQNLISYLLRKAGAEVEVADNGKIAVEKATAEHFDLILMDIQMPEMDGYEATRVLRKRGFTRPVLALTAHAMSNDREKCLQAGCDDYMAKPINPAKLVQTVAQHGGKEVSTDQKSTDSAPKPSTAATQPIESEFADDPDFAQIIDQFVAGLTDKVESMQQALANADFETLQRLAHQLKGAAGSYGYPALTDPAKALEEAAKARDHEAAGLAFTPLVKLCQAIIAARKAETPSDGA